jgi:hypothetical protein
LGYLGLAWASKLTGTRLIKIFDFFSNNYFPKRAFFKLYTTSQRSVMRDCMYMGGDLGGVLGGDLGGNLGGYFWGIFWGIFWG